MNFPKTKKENIVDDLFGYKISDPFRWLENGEDAEVKKWIDDQNEATFSSFKDEEFGIIQKELAENYKYTGFGNPFLVKGKYFYTERGPDENQSVLYYKNGIDGTPIKLVDPNILNKTGTTTIDYWGVSLNGKYLNYGLSENN